LVSSYLAPADDGSHLLKLWERIAVKDTQASLSLRQREFLAGVAAGTAYSEAYASVIATDTAAQLRALRCPTLVFAGTSDPLYPQLDAAFQLLANGRKAEIAGARTFVCERQTAEVAALLKDFLGDHHG
ncbi:MAG TPA: alpha/beta hydrolase, partial [Fontimonas sp.]